MARKMSLKQKAAFGSKRVRAAAKAALSRQRSRKRNAPKAKHRPRTKPAPKKRRKRSNPPVAKRKRRAAPRSATAPRKKRRRKNGSKRRVAKRKNTGALYALVNPARKKGTSMARRRKNRRRKSTPAGGTRRRRRTNTGRRANRRRNPGTMGRPMDWLALGGGAIIGGLGATSLPQMVLGASNTGPMGYLGMAAATALLAFATHMIGKKNVMLTSGVIAGGAGALIKRIIGDYTPFGQYLNAQSGQSGMGDYLSGWNFPVPQIIGGNGNTSLGAAGTIPVSVAGAGSGAGRALMNV
jgi:hypothetical protein